MNCTWHHRPLPAGYIFAQSWLFLSLRYSVLPSTAVCQLFADSDFDCLNLEWSCIEMAFEFLIQYMINDNQGLQKQHIRCYIVMRRLGQHSMEKIYPGTYLSPFGSTLLPLWQTWASACECRAWRRRRCRRRSPSRGSSLPPLPSSATAPWTPHSTGAEEGRMSYKFRFFPAAMSPFSLNRKRITKNVKTFE